MNVLQCIQPLRCQGIKSDALVTRAHQIAIKIFEYLAISEVWYTDFAQTTRG